MLSRTPWLARFGADPAARLRLFCFPYAGGGAALYRPWARLAPPGVELCAVQLPGRENRIVDEPFRRWAPLVEALAAELAPYLDLPFAFFGYSMGALVSFEVARHLARQGGPQPIHLHVAAHRAPHMPPRRAPIHGLPAAAFIHQLRELKGTPDEVLAHAELMELLLPVLRADFEVCETYAFAPGPPLRCPITALGGLEDPRVSREDLLEWSALGGAPAGLRLYPGGHFFLHDVRDQVLRDVLEDLGPAL